MTKSIRLERIIKVYLLSLAGFCLSVLELFRSTLEPSYASQPHLLRQPSS